MLVLTRKPGEALRLGDDITITVLSVKGNLVRVGIAAPKSIPIHREEVYGRIQQESHSEDASDAKALPGSGTTPAPAIG